MQATEEELVRRVREALANLYDPGALRAQPLFETLLQRRYARTADVREQLIESIERLRPGQKVDPNTRAWRPYRILHQRYVERRDAAEVQHDLALSKSQYYREHDAALAALAGLLSLEPLSNVLTAPASQSGAAPRN